jgi:hypothetical protein
MAAGHLLVGAPPASAGTYNVYGCQTPTGAKALMDGWTSVLNAPPSYWSSSCPAPVSMGMAASSAHADGQFDEATFVAPRDTTIVHYDIVRAVRLTPSGGYYYQLQEDSSGFWTLLEGCRSAAGCHNVGDDQNPAAKANLFSHADQNGTTAVQLKLLCGHSGGCPEEPNGSTASLWLFSSLFTLQDNQAPQFAGQTGGPLVSGGVLSGVVPVTIAATDQGGGVYQAQIEVDGRVVQSQVLSNSTRACQQPFVAAVPCPLSANGTLYLDTAQLPDGTHSLNLRVTDVAGNVSSWPGGPVTITTVNSPCSPFPAASGTSLHAGLVQRSHKRARLVSRLTIDYTQRPTVLGSVISTNDAPVPGAPVCVVAQDTYAGAPMRPVASLTTGPQGTFSYRLASGPSRTLYFIYRVPGGAVSDTVRVAVHVPVLVHVNRHVLRNGQTMVWSGRLPGPVPRGLLGLMQVWRGTFWQTISPDAVPIRQNGRWTGRYPFQFTTGRQVYKFRFLVPGQSEYPYVSGASRPFKVTVVGS